MEPELQRPGIDSGPPEESAWAFLGFAWRRLWIIVVIVAAAAGLGYFKFVRTVPVFQSTAQILVVRNRPTLPISGVTVETKDEDAVLRSPKLISKAVERLNLDELPTLKAAGNPVSAIIGGLTTTVTQGLRLDPVRLFQYGPFRVPDHPPGSHRSVYRVRGGNPPGL